MKVDFLWTFEEALVSIFQADLEQIPRVGEIYTVWPSASGQSLLPVRWKVEQVEYFQGARGQNAALYVVPA